MGAVLLVVVEQFLGKTFSRGPGRQQKFVVFIIVLHQTQDLHEVVWKDGEQTIEC